jgi:hypothetical protein
MFTNKAQKALSSVPHLDVFYYSIRILSYKIYIEILFGI